jgi:GntR family transcriptional repressor for pyruvate dehydrogenase complex
MDNSEVGIEPIKRIRAHEAIVLQLQTLMERELLRPGDRLPTERDLAKRFGVSRVTLRQALSVLQAKELIDSRIGDGTFASARPFTVTALASILHGPRGSLAEQLELRRLIEPQVARLAAERATTDAVNELEEHLGVQEGQMREGVPFIDEDSAFHMVIARASGNMLLVKMIESIHVLLRDSREQSLRAPGGMERSLRGHRRILDAIKAHDGSAAEEATLHHTHDVEELIILSSEAVSPSMDDAVASGERTRVS